MGTLFLVLIALIVFSISAFLLLTDNLKTGSIGIILFCLLCLSSAFGEFTGCSSDQVIAFNENFEVKTSLIAVSQMGNTRHGNFRREYEVKHNFIFNYTTDNLQIVSQVPLIITVGIVDLTEFFKQQASKGNIPFEHISLLTSDKIIASAIKPCLDKIQETLQQQLNDQQSLSVQNIAFSPEYVRQQVISYLQTNLRQEHLYLIKIKL